MELTDFFMAVQKLVYLHCHRVRRGEGREGGGGEVAQAPYIEQVQTGAY